MKIKHCITTIFLLQGFILLAQNPFKKESITYDFSSLGNFRYRQSARLNQDLKYDGPYVIKNRKDSTVVGLVHYKEGMLVDSATINTPEIKFKGFFIYNEKYKGISIEDLDAYGVPHGEFTLEKFSKGTRVFYTKDTYTYGVKNGYCERFDYNQWDSPGYGTWYKFQMKDGVYDGFYLKQYEMGDTIEFGKYLQGKREGSWLTTNRYSGFRDIENYYHGIRQGSHKTWNAKGQLILEEYYNNGLLDSIRRDWNGNGNMRFEANYKMGKKQGVVKSWYENGKTYYIEMYDTLGELHGTVTYYYENGKVQMLNHYEHGNAEGLFQVWNEEEVLIEQTSYHKGEQNGKYESYYDNGKPKKTAYYTNNQLNGVLKEWDEKGTLVLHEQYKNGELIKTYKDSRPIEKDDNLYTSNQMGELSEDYYIKPFHTNYSNLKGFAEYPSLVCVKKKSESFVDILNAWYQSLDKKQKKSADKIQRIEITFELARNSVTIVVVGANKKLNEELQTYLLQKMPTASCFTYFDSSIKVTVPFEPSMK